MTKRERRIAGIFEWRSSRSESQIFADSDGWTRIIRRKLESLRLSKKGSGDLVSGEDAWETEERAINRTTPNIRKLESLRYKRVGKRNSLPTTLIVPICDIYALKK